MEKETYLQMRIARHYAILAVVFVTLFAAVFVGSVYALDRFGPEKPRAVAEVEIEDIPEASALQRTFYVLLIGSDTRKGTALYTGKASDHAQVDQHSDIMTLVRVDPQAHSISLLSIPRDTVVTGQTSRINDALLKNKPKDVVEAVAELTGLKADYFMMTTFVTFERFIDAIGGIDVDVPKAIKVSNPGSGGSISLKAGENQHLNGAQALALARARKEYGDDQDAVRQTNVRNIEEAIIRKVLAYDGGVADVEKLLGIVEEDVKTNMDLPVLGLTVLDFIDHADEVTFLSGSGPYAGGGERESDGAWVIPADDETWAKVMEVFKAGGDTTTIVKPATVSE